MNPYTPTPEGAITSRMVELLRQTKPWVRLLSIVGFVGSGLMALGGLFMMVAGLVGGAMGRSMGSALGGAPMLLMGVLYLLMSVLYIFPSLFLFRYASAIARMIAGQTVSGMEEALAAQKSFWKFFGIMVIIVLVIYALLLVFVVAAGIFAALQR